MNVPDYLHPHVGQLLGIETEAASRTCYWAVVLGLSPFKEGDKWCVLWGENLQDGVAGFGDTPAHAISDFEMAMNNKEGKSHDTQRRRNHGAEICRP